MLLWKFFQSRIQIRNRWNKLPEVSTDHPTTSILEVFLLSLRVFNVVITRNLIFVESKCFPDHKKNNANSKPHNWLFIVLKFTISPGKSKGTDSTFWSQTAFASVARYCIYAPNQCAIIGRFDRTRCLALDPYEAPILCSLFHILCGFYVLQIFSHENQSSNPFEWFRLCYYCFGPTTAIGYCCIFLKKPTNTQAVAGSIYAQALKAGTPFGRAPLNLSNYLGSRIITFRINMENDVLSCKYNLGDFMKSSNDDLHIVGIPGHTCGKTAKVAVNATWWNTKKGNTAKLWQTLIDVLTVSHNLDLFKKTKDVTALAETPAYAGSVTLLLEKCKLYVNVNKQIST